MTNILAMLIGANILIIPIICSILAMIVLIKVNKIYKQNKKILDIWEKDRSFEDR